MDKETQNQNLMDIDCPPNNSSILSNTQVTTGAASILASENLNINTPTVIVPIPQSTTENLLKQFLVNAGGINETMNEVKKISEQQDRIESSYKQSVVNNSKEIEYLKEENRIFRKRLEKLEFLEYEIELLHQVEIDTVFRVGKYREGSNRPIRLRFITHRDRNTVFEARGSLSELLSLKEDQPFSLRRDHAILRRKKQELIDSEIPYEINWTTKSITAATSQTLQSVNPMEQQTSIPQVLLDGAPTNGPNTTTSRPRMFEFSAGNTSKQAGRPAYAHASGSHQNHRDQRQLHFTDASASKNQGQPPIKRRGTKKQYETNPNFLGSRSLRSAGVPPINKL
ncbi:unnamed protein product [Orchesella dallaii]|uniref:Uncharacterized protein n=1 Tax=Orchesella dallaii TaxID=48710 RepID=A0ABP1PZJ3_9HEXA